ncbi:MAG: serine/threonine protein kinase [Acidobacteria bacterium]|nr:serine/threonine protein kinase [Acidobacteriota bacterium]
MPHSSDDWRRIFDLFDRAADRPVEERDAWLERECRGDDPAILAAVRRMIENPTDLGDDRLVHHAAASVRHELEAMAEGDASGAGDIRLGPWRVIREIGRGGMGVVYLAERADGGFDQCAAVKCIRRGLDTDEVLARFLRERQILARLQHPGIARLIDGGADHLGRPYFVMEYVEGEPITTYCDRRGLSVEQRLRLFLAACVGVEFAHRNLVVHRDLKPSNIMVTADGAVKLLDFGIAKLLTGDGTEGADATGTGMAALTPAYAAPEQIRGEPATTATDVYGLGGVLYELLAGCRALDAPDESPLTLARTILERDPAAPSSRLTGAGRRRLRGELDAVVLTALRREPEARTGQWPRSAPTSIGTSTVCRCRCVARMCRCACASSCRVTGSASLPRASSASPSRPASSRRSGRRIRPPEPRAARRR